jgi:hut operon positive regulator
MEIKTKEEMDSIGKTALLIVLARDERHKETLIQKAKERGYEVCTGKVGSMDARNVFAAIEVAAKRNNLISDLYREEHALWHATVDALRGLLRGELELGSLLRTIGINFCIIKETQPKGKVTEGKWLAVALYGFIGAPIKGHEHEAVGLGISHL